MVFLSRLSDCCLRLMVPLREPGGPSPHETVNCLFLHMDQRRKTWFGLVACLPLFVGSLHFSPLTIEMDASGVVVRVVDGDTFEMAGVGRIRLADIDAPESGQVGYREAADS